MVKGIRVFKRNGTAKSIGLALVLPGLFVAAGGPAHAAVVTQAPCVASPNDYCVQFRNTGAIPLVRRLTFRLTRAGKAVVTFHGSVVCTTSSGGKGHVELVSQIVNSIAAVPDETQPGGLRHNSTLPPAGRAAFNLASTRVFTIPAAGTFVYAFKIARVQMTAATTCRVFNAVLTVQTDP
jgi:hypothetical protein